MLPIQYCSYVLVSSHFFHALRLVEFEQMALLYLLEFGLFDESWEVARYEKRQMHGHEHRHINLNYISAFHRAHRPVVQFVKKRKYFFSNTLTSHSKFGALNTWLFLALFQYFDSTVYLLFISFCMIPYFFLYYLQ